MKVTNKQIINVFWKHVRKYPVVTAMLLTGTFSVYTVEIITPWFYKKFFDTLAAPIANGADILVHTLFIIIALELLAWLIYRLNAVGLVRLETRVIADLNETSFNYLIGHSYSFFTNSFAGSLVRKVNRLSRAFEEVADQVQFSLIPLIVTVVGILIGVSFRSIVLTATLGVWVIIFLTANYFFARWKQPYEIAKSMKDTEATGVLADAIGNSTTIKLFTGHEHEKQRYHNIIEEWRKVYSFTWNISEIAYGVQSLLMIAIEFIMLYIAIKLWRVGILTVGDFVLIQIYIIRLMRQLWDFGRILRRFYMAFADAAEMVEILELPHEIKDRKTAKELAVRQGKIEFNNVDFGFHQTRKVLNRFNLVIQPGERVALVGPSGAGKSTITHLLFRFFEIDAGHILIDGQDISKVTQKSLRDQIALVPQEPILFHRTLLDNIRYGQRGASDAEVVEAAKKAHCHDFINELPFGYDTYVGERGIKLSGGERQRVAIARAILKNAPILVLDEATSSLDSESEALIQDALRELMKGKTVIVIAHRLSTILSMDRIIVIENGKVIDMGTHQELLNRQGIYKKLWEIQAGGFLP
ncbi:hypothetical protein A3H10_04125 [Candidatus Uhrbacteria bacterium RIFCSPLOWO2_12_FULL_46_10]|uniref:ABC transporter ATP-binding protein n=1 Tax=Candidatus Uhrbacteria bacterium RIFCSPLOWO2_01_FULL_47_25 TaxID=1802402 RepID=A0A1F7UTA6_9BACT|nr:MAG: hypothetical protein A2752_05120 [Candidatus Uhrbacteria bacterium RIFCSPHIGHO2_01_FULL_46_23]OGL67861.1 MAG: hypothetical protein A3D60_01335 [Candidatus Uhrbacteria bacterium RIFCSPHIGHO2_02_FULL_47_29]OGL81522.1 MAG: hypothetical protein A2936_01635 [Candidatus Uhrbacteria bacterium RIFCSPLOWO2_01_FULL_47_25]OGL85744.1 MAG: hypothetical protein A3I37_02575 [Candidatus Uhrbacteria bacterium RIFCSPLOWO2_02_FULL_46_19]OGL90615.1 MAG: hypothetical protein A3H10_04125 [Candidatus Uhrbacte